MGCFSFLRLRQGDRGGEVGFFAAAVEVNRSRHGLRAWDGRGQLCAWSRHEFLGERGNLLTPGEGWVSPHAYPR